MKQLAILLGLIALVALPALANATAMPIRTGYSGPVQARPYSVGLSVDGTGILGGFTGRHPTLNTANRHGWPFGRLRWTTWNPTEGRAWGAEWLDRCNPNCGEGTYSAYKANIHVYDPSTSGVFQRMTIQSRVGARSYSAYHDSGTWRWG
jgi:hypothetical protein